MFVCHGQMNNQPKKCCQHCLKKVSPKIKKLKKKKKRKKTKKKNEKNDAKKEKNDYWKK